MGENKWRDIPRPIVQALRALHPLVYVRTKDPDALVRALGEAVASVFPILLTTEADRPNVVKGGRPGRREHYLDRDQQVKTLPNTDDPGKSEQNILSFLAECNPADEQAYAIVRVGSDGIGHGRNAGVRDPIARLWQHRDQDHHWIALAIFVGDLPANKAVHGDLKFMFYPIDLIEPEVPEQPREHRLTVATDYGLQRRFNYVCQLLTPRATVDDRFDLSEEQLARLRGMDPYEAELGMSFSLVASMDKAKTSGTDRAEPRDELLDPAILQAYKNRWARVA